MIEFKVRSEKKIQTTSDMPLQMTQHLAQANRCREHGTLQEI